VETIGGGCGAFHVSAFETILGQRVETILGVIRKDEVAGLR